MRTHISLGGLAAFGGLLALTLGGCGGVADPAAEKTLRAKLGQASVTIFPAFVRAGGHGPKTYDPAVAQRIGDAWTEAKLGTATVSDVEVPINSPWSMNQAKMHAGSLADFRAYIQQHPLKTDYALLPEYLFSKPGGVVGVHVYVLDADGVCPYAVLLNSHWEAFNAVNPKTVDDCTQIVLNVLKAELRPPGENK
jgi:hypothetical protein